MSKPNHHLSVEEPRQIELRRASKVSVDVIAERFGWHRSTIFRELERNLFQDAALPKVHGFFGEVSNLRYLTPRQRRQKLRRYP